MSDLKARIKDKLSQQNISASALEKKAGIRPSTLQNILQGRSKNPSIDVLQAVARSLSCTVSDLLGETKAHLPHATSADIVWRGEVYVSVTTAVWDTAQKRGCNLSRQEFFEAVENVYTYCMSYKREKVDMDFVTWVLDHEGH